MTNIEERIDHFLTEQEWLNERIDRIFEMYCKIFDIHRAYGVESWEIYGNHLTIIQDTSCMGCYNNESHSLPIEYLYNENYEELMKRDYDEKLLKKKEAQKQEAERRAVEREKNERATYERLRSKFEGENHD